MIKDQWGYPLASDNAAAVEAFQQAGEEHVILSIDAVPLLDKAIEIDPEFGLPYVAKGLLFTGLRKPAVYPRIQGLLDQAKACRPAVSDRERYYMAALEEALAGRITGCASQLEAVSRAYPLDVFAQRLAQFELFWIGEVEWMRDITERAAPAWSRDVPAFSKFQSVRSFSLEETGEMALAEKCGREAVEIDPTDCWGAHAIAHVLVMQGRLDEGVRWIDDLSVNWARSNPINPSPLVASGALLSRTERPCRGAFDL